MRVLRRLEVAGHKIDLCRSVARGGRLLGGDLFEDLFQGLDILLIARPLESLRHKDAVGCEVLDAEFERKLVQKKRPRRVRRGNP